MPDDGHDYGTYAIVHLNDDWMGVYRNGALLIQGHSVSAQDLIRVRTGAFPASHSIEDESLVELPARLSDLRFDGAA